MSGLYIALTVVVGVICLALVVAILLQKKRDAGFSGAAGGAMSGDKAQFDKIKKRSLEGRLEKYTKILGAVFMVLALVLSLMV
ncbi:MAG: preprotein translocase subunit SecG [Defluviitaleaceae bacterium]|nr:preprotein translocase subunit SecG [Defluviitaleaceae bacterium]